MTYLNNTSTRSTKSRTARANNKGAFEYITNEPKEVKEIWLTEWEEKPEDHFNQTQEQKEKVNKGNKAEQLVYDYYQKQDSTYLISNCNASAVAQCCQYDMIVINTAFTKMLLSVKANKGSRSDNNEAYLNPLEHPFEPAGLFISYKLIYSRASTATDFVVVNLLDNTFVEFNRINIVKHWNDLPRDCNGQIMIPNNQLSKYGIKLKTFKEKK